MSSKPPSTRNASAGMARLAGWQVLEARGPEAGAFLQRQSMNDVALLAKAGDWQWNGLLSAKGRVQALFVLLRLDADTFWLVAPDVPAAGLRELLARFVLRSKLSLAERTDVLPFAAWADPQPVDALGARGASLLASVQFEAGRALLLARAEPDFAVDANADARWRLEDLLAGLPRLAPEQADTWTPHMLALDRLSAFSLKKGCYPGQEIVARTHYLGRVKRQLQRLLADREVARGDALLDSGGTEFGQVLCSAGWQSRWVAQAVLPLEESPVALVTPAGASLHPLPERDEAAVHNP